MARGASRVHRSLAVAAQNDSKLEKIKLAARAALAVIFSAMSQEKRIARRFPMQLAVSEKTADGGMFQSFGQTRDLSAGGVFFYTDEEFTPGSRFELILPLPPQLADAREVWVLCQAEVVRSEVGPDGRRGVGALIQKYEIVPEV